jgi:hypothetical protein
VNSARKPTLSVALRAEFTDQSANA